VLDPQDWSAFRTLSHAALDDALDYLQGVRDRPAWSEMPQDVRQRLEEPMPREAASLEEVYREFASSIFPYNSGNIHPRFFGWVQGAGTPTGVLAELLAATMNANVGGRNHGAVYVERLIIRWFCSLFGFPDDASGVMTIGTSAANLIAVVVARTKALGPRVREQGIAIQREPLVAYASSATHGCVRRAFDVCGLGSASLRVLQHPFMLIGNAGTVDVGAIDPLDDLAALAHREGLWFHVDGAFAATAMMSATLAPRFKGIEYADSIAFDFHKWLQAPYDAGCLLVKDGEAHRAAFASAPNYLTRMPRGLASAQPWFTDYTIDLSRGFRALKVWFTIKEHGSKKLGWAMEENVRQAQLLGSMIDADTDFELLAPVQLNIVCFRYRRDGLTEVELDALNDELVIELQESGEAVTSSTTIGSRRAIRICIVNHRTRDTDLVATLDALRAIAATLSR
jgi:aromatic-L-amino-acid decarboxylase